MNNAAMDSETSTTPAMNFSILSSAAPVLAPRVGKLAIPGRQAISTPHFVPLTTRGAVSHIAHDVVRKETAINSLFLGLEDCTFDYLSTSEAPTTPTNTSPVCQLSRRSTLPRYIKLPSRLENPP